MNSLIVDLVIPCLCIAFGYQTVSVSWAGPTTGAFIDGFLYGLCEESPVKLSAAADPASDEELHEVEAPNLSTWAGITDRNGVTLGACYNSPNPDYTPPKMGTNEAGFQKLMIRES